MKPLTFAVVGDVHGEMHAMLRLVAGLSNKAGRALDFVLQVGDFEPHRHEADLATMAAPQKYRKLGDFHQFHQGAARFPWPVHFIGGNHEPYGFLDAMPAGGDVAERCHYLGRVGALELDGMRVVGLSGIFQEDTYARGRPDIAAVGSTSLKAYIGFSEAEVEAAASLGPADVLLVHEWPDGIGAPPHLAKDFEEGRGVSRRPLGNEPARLLVELLSPQIVFCGHMHARHRGELRAGARRVPVVCLASIREGKDAVAILERTETGALRELTIG